MPTASGILCATYRHFTGGTGHLNEGISNHRRIVGGKLCPVLKQFGLLCDRNGDTANVMICRRGHWNVRMNAATLFSMLSAKWHFKEPRHRAGAGFEARLAYAVAGFNILAQWSRLEPDAPGRVYPSLTQSSL